MSTTKELITQLEIQCHDCGKVLESETYIDQIIEVKPCLFCLVSAQGNHNAHNQEEAI